MNQPLISCVPQRRPDRFHRLGLATTPATQPWSVAFVNGGRTIAATSNDNRLRLRSLDGKSAQAMLVGSRPGDARGSATVPSPDSRRVLAGRYCIDLASGAALWQVPTPFPAATLFLDDDTILVRDARYCAATGLPTGTLMATRRRHDEVLILSLARSPDGTTLATGDMNGIIVLTHLATGEPFATTHSMLRNAEALAFGRDFIAVGGEGFHVRLLGARDLAPLGVLPIPRGAGQGSYWPETRSLAFAPDGVTLVAVTRARFPLAGANPHGHARSESYVIVWNTLTGQERARWLFPHGLLHGLALGDDGRTLALATTVGVYLRDLALD
jgi:hypothetical protein